MLLGVIADDFTGASDIANTLAKGFGEAGGLSYTPARMPSKDLAASACILA